MDVAKYIGLFLLKNEQCYINGLGTLQFIRKGGNYDGQSLHAAHNEVTLVPGGNVDESLANFIATNEMTSISKASDTLKEYSADTKTQLQDGKEVPIPFIGNFALRDGRIIFITDPLLLYKPSNIPAQRGASLHHNERPSTPQGFVFPTAAPNPNVAMPGPTSVPQSGGYPQQPVEEEGGRLNWWRIIFVLLLLIIMAAGAYYAYYRFLAPKPRTTQQPLSVPQMNDIRSEERENNTENEFESTQNSMNATDNEEKSPVVNEQDSKMEEARTEQPKQLQPDKTEPAVNKKEEQKPAKKEAITPNPPTPTNMEPKELISFEAVINTYDNKEQAYKRMRELRRYGKAIVIEEDTNYYFVAIPITTTKDRKKRVIDSLTNKYNLDGVFVY